MSGRGGVARRTRAIHYEAGQELGPLQQRQWTNSLPQPRLRDWQKRFARLTNLRDRTMVGLKIHLHASRSAAVALAGQTELFLLDKGYAGLETVEDGIANLSLVLPASKVAGIGRGWRPLHDFLMQNNPPLGERLETFSALWDKPLAVACPKAGTSIEAGASRAKAPCIRLGTGSDTFPLLPGTGSQ